MNSEEVKQIAKNLGADLCGIAGVDRFADAPGGFQPLDVLPTCKSVISFACRLPAGTLACKTAVPYTIARNTITPKMDAIALDLCIELEKHGILSVQIPTNEGLWDKNTNRRRSIVSLKHAAQAAGLGTVGRHSLLITPEFGSMVWLGAVLTEAELEADDMLTPVCTECNLCVEACPVNALADTQVDQGKCWDNAFGENPETGDWQISCHKCRDICPYNLGSMNKNFRR